MSPDPVIKSILIRYEKDLPVSIEEKAVLHKWLVDALRSTRPQPPAEDNFRILSFPGLIRNLTSAFFRIFAHAFQQKNNYHD